MSGPRRLPGRGGLSLVLMEEWKLDRWEWGGEDILGKGEKFHSLCRQLSVKREMRLVEGATSEEGKVKNAAGSVSQRLFDSPGCSQIMCY